MTERRLACSPTAKAVLIAVLIGGTALAWWTTRAPRPRPEEGTAGPVSASAAIPRRTRATPAPTPRDPSVSPTTTAHFTVSDIAQGAFHDHERLSRGAMGLAGAEPGTLHLWLDDWSATPTVPEGLPVRLRAAQGEVAIDLRLARGKPPCHTAIAA